MGAAEAADDATCDLRAYVEAIVRDDFEIACSYLCKAGRALALVQAKFDGLDTDDCAAALAYVMQRHAGDQPRPADALTSLIESVARVEMIDADHAIVRLVPGWFARWDNAHADKATCATTRRVPNGDGDELPLVREDEVGRSALSAAAVGGHLQLHSAARRHGVNTSRVDGDGESARAAHRFEPERLLSRPPLNPSSRAAHDDGAAGGRNRTDRNPRQAVSMRRTAISAGSARWPRRRCGGSHNWCLLPQRRGARAATSLGDPLSADACFLAPCDARG